MPAEKVFKCEQQRDVYLWSYPQAKTLGRDVALNAVTKIDLRVLRESEGEILAIESATLV